MNIRGKVCCVLSIIGVVLFAFSPTVAMADKSITYKVTIYNLTAGQPFTPPVVVTHNRRTAIFRIGDQASEGVRSIAENGNNVPLVTALSGDVNVSHIVEGTAPVVPANNPGGSPFESSVTFTITTDRKARHLSFVSMLICTNDGFTGINSVRLPKHRKTVYTAAYETRTERNTEDFADIVPPCQGLIGESSDDMGTGSSNPLLAEKGIIIPHVGIIGGTDLQPAIHGWSDPVAKVVIERVRRDHR